MDVFSFDCLLLVKSLKGQLNKIFDLCFSFSPLTISLKEFRFFLKLKQILYFNSKIQKFLWKNGNKNHFELEVVIAWPSGAVSFPDHVKGGGPWAAGPGDHPLSLLGHEFLLGGSHLLRVQAPDIGSEGQPRGLQEVFQVACGLLELALHMEDIS